MPLFSVVVPTYNRPAYLAAALRSLLVQSCGDFECVVVDDCSDLAARVPDDPRFRIVRRSENGGPAAAVNVGLREVCGDFVIRMDDDDMFAQNRLEVACRGLSRAPVALCWSQYLDEFGTGKGARPILEGDVGDVILNRITPHMGAAAVARDHFLPLDESYAGSEDVEWWLRLALRSQVTTVGEVGYLIRRHPGLRVTHGAAARAAGSRRLLEQHARYFRAHPKAAALRWKRIGLNELELGSKREARVALGHSLRLDPDLGTLRNLLRTL